MTVWLVNSGDNYNDIEKFLGESALTLPCLMDTENLYQSYPLQEAGEGYAPYPLQLVIDQNGVVRHMAQQYDAANIRGVIDELLAQ